MKHAKNWSIFILITITLSFFNGCGKEGSDDSVLVGSSTPLTSANLTDYGYYDGLLYYKITSNSPNEVIVNKANKSATKVEIPKNVTIDNKVFNCTKIGSGAFEGCSNLETVIIPSSFTAINTRAFALSGIVTLDIPNGIKKIESIAFEQCSKLKVVTIPSSVIEIESSAFYYCTSLESIRFPSSIKTIGDMALDGCSSLTSIHCSWTNPPALESPINQNIIYSKAILYVPKGYAKNYINVLPWSLFKNIKEE